MDIDTMVESHFKKNRDVFGFESVAKLIEEVMDSMGVVGLPLQLLQEEGVTPESESFDWHSIPELPISELGWSDTRTREQAGGLGGQRKLLEDYLKNITGGDLTTKLKELNKFMSNPDLDSDSPGDKIAKILGYLVFYKTLTRVITNFNASSAGFSFESFLAVLTGGKQIETGGETIADYKDAEGNPVSLKLYSETSVEVGGSFQDLVDDLANDTENKNQMTYLVVLKSLEGEGLDQEGTLSFYQFTLSLDNVGYFIDKSSTESRTMLALPLNREGQLIGLPSSDPEGDEQAPEEIEEATQRVRLSGKEFAKNFNETLAAEVKAQLEKRIEQIPELAQVPALGELVNLIQLGGKNFPKLTGDGVAQAHKAIKDAVDEITTQDPEVAKLFKQKVPKLIGTGSGRLDLAIKADFKSLLNGLLQTLKKDPEAVRKTGADTLLKNIRVDQKSVTRSIEYYNSLKGQPDLQKKALFSSYGYLGAKKFGVGKGVATGKTKVNLMPVSELGVLEIGASRIVPLLEEARSELNDQVFGIFKNLKTLSTQINAFFASGLKDGEAGREASQASKAIATSTEEVVTQKK